MEIGIFEYDNFAFKRSLFISISLKDYCLAIAVLSNFKNAIVFSGFCYDDIDFVIRGIIMRAFEVMATLSNSKQLLLDSDLDWDTSRVKVIILESDEVEFDPDDTPVEEVKASLRRALQDYKEGKTRPVSELWERI